MSLANQNPHRFATCELFTFCSKGAICHKRALVMPELTSQQSRCTIKAALAKAIRPIQAAAGGKMTLRFVHLSDIHFHTKGPDIGFDPDRDVRSELIRDVRSQVAESGAAAAVLVSGDIAYSGKKHEYADAASWLDQLCAAAGCAAASVYVCPGNHDVDRSVIIGSPTIQDIHQAVRSEPEWPKWDEKLNRRLIDSVGARFLFEPLKEYNEFAARYECSFFPEVFAWDKDFPLNDGSVLRLRGMNSAILSGPADGYRTLCLGSKAWTLPRHDGIEYMVMSHHPPAWLKDGNESQVSFDAKSKIQIFGHEHDQRLMAGRDFIRLFSGSVNPERSEPNWRPGYNIIDIAIESEAQQRRMIVDVRQREWSRQPLKFQSLRNARDQEVDRSIFELPKWQPSATWQTPPIPSEEKSVNESAASQPSTTPDSNRPTRDVINQFFRLTVSQKNQVTGTLSLSEDADRGLPDFERYIRALQRARSGGKWLELEEMLNNLGK